MSEPLQTMTASLLDLRFVGCLMLFGLLRHFVPTRHYIAFAVAGSAVLLGMAAPQTLIAVSATTLLLVYPVHLLTRWSERRGAPKHVTSILLACAVVCLVVMLVWFKVYRHFPLPGLGGQWIGERALALVGFSYFILRAIGFLHIQSILKNKEDNPFALLLFLLFPPTLSSGPLQKFQDFRAQVRAPAPLSVPLLLTVAYRLTRGYFRKVVLAVMVSNVAERLVAVQEPSAYVTIAAVAALYVFFYLDFAGYSDIAIAFGLLLGIRVPENFRQPFLATTVSEFWRNWHITLVDWFRDQVFIPLGGMSGSRFRAACLGLLIMLLCGFWHGLTWGFLAWGLWHGSLLFTEAIAGAKPIPPARRSGPAYWGRVLWTNSRIAFGAIFFLDTGVTLRLLSGLANWRVH